MSETIPADVMHAALDCGLFRDPEGEGLLTIARAILSERDRATAAERARCEKIVRAAFYEGIDFGNDGPEWSEDFKEGGWNTSDAAAAIRNPMEGRG